MSTTTTDPNAETMQIIQIADQMQPLMRQLPANVQGGVLASLLARWIADHEVVDDRPATLRLHDRIMRNHFRLIMKLLIAAQKDDQDNSDPSPPEAA